MKLHVEVTAEDIAKGKRNRTDCCPIALAISRCNGVSDVGVDEATASMSHGGEWVFAEMPKEAAAFVLAFDKRKPVEPFAFDLEVVR